MPKRSIPLLVLILVTPFVAAQDPGGRVQREASNPLRMIIEASKIKPRQKAAEAARAAEKPSAEAASAAKPALDATAQSAVARNDAPASGPAESTVATVVVEVPAVTDQAEASAVPAATLSVAAAPAALELASMVEPVTPRSLLGKLRDEVQVHVVFTVNVDGSVVDPAVRKSTHPQMDAAVLEAVRQWRYQPIAAPRAHEVQLVLRQGD